MLLDLGLALGGIPTGAVYALLALGIVLVYKTTRVFNFAQAGLGMLAAYDASFATYTLHLPTLLGCLVGVATATVGGVLIEWTSIRWTKPGLPRTIVTLGWLLALQGFCSLAYGTGNDQRIAAPFSGARAFGVDRLGLSYGYDQIGVLVVVLVVLASLVLFFRLSALGTAMRSVADSPDAALLLGLRVGRVTLLSWGLGGTLAGLSGVLVSPLLRQIDTTSLLILTIEALAAALVGRLTSLPLTVAGGLVLGIVQPVVRHELAPTVGTDELTALAFVLAALLVRKQTGRRDQGGGGLAPLVLRPLPRGPAALGGLGGIALALVGTVLVTGSTGNDRIAETGVWAIACLSLVLLTGVVGQVSLCQCVFMAVGAYTGAIASADGFPWPLCVLAGALGATLAAVLVGVPSLRLQPLELAITTLAVSFAGQQFLYSWAPLVGDSHRRPFPVPEILNPTPSGNGTTGARLYALLLAVLFVALAFAVASLRRGRTGAGLTALRSSEAAAAAMGFSVVATKLRGFAASGFVAGVAGAAYAGLSDTATSNAFGAVQSISLLSVVVIAGLGSLPGAVLGGVLVTLTASGAGGDADVTSATTLVTGAVLVLVVVLFPEGLAGAVTRLRDARVRPDELAAAA